MLVSTVLDVVRADMPVAILDTSAATHMPDVLEMPYRPMVIVPASPARSVGIAVLRASPASRGT